MTHPTDDDLILHFYRETPPDDAAAIDAHLGVCPQCRDAWSELGATLALVDRAPCPEPDPAFERVIWARIRPQIDMRRRRALWTWVAPLAAAAVVTLALGIAVVHHRNAIRAAATVARATPAPSGAGARELRERVLLTAMDDHVEEAQLLLVELMNAPESAASDVGYARETAGELVAAGRLYRATAIQSGNTQLASMIDDLEPVLVEVARSPDSINAADLEAIRARITDGRLLFKMRAAANEIHERQRATVAAATE